MLTLILFKEKNNITGPSISISQTSGDGPLHVSIDVTGIDQSSPTQHGFHVHQYGKLDGGCGSTGSHFNPHGKLHGAPDDTDR